jgi:hypothetical protein
MLVKYVLSDDISQAFLPFRFVDVIVITDHDLFWNVGQACYILKYFENMMIKNAWEISSLKTYLTSIMIRKNRH